MTERPHPPALKSLPGTTEQATAADAQTAPALEGAKVAARKGVRSVTDLHWPATAAPADRRNAT
ncbi:hypothetical protein [Streptomyces sp. NPDC058572]|uniref:hypothetical protein n=1 Tax=Streptomyces sp. NPDC058572 TaxID=3346546 RepID=UPI00365F8D76